MTKGLLIIMLFMVACRPYPPAPKCTAGTTHSFGKWEDVRSFKNMQGTTSVEVKRVCNDCGWVNLSINHNGRKRVSQ